MRPTNLAIAEIKAALKSSTPTPEAQSPLDNFWAGMFAPQSIAPLVFFRIFFGAMMLYHLYGMTVDHWIHFFYIAPDFHFTYPGFEWVQPWPGDGMYLHVAVMGVAAMGISLGLFYRLSALVFCLGYTHLFLIEKALYQNHCYLICLLSGILIVIPAHRACSLDAFFGWTRKSNAAPTWALGLVRLQLGIPYFYGGLAKLNADWLHSQPMKLWLVRRSDVPFVGELLTWDWAPFFFSYSGILLDLLIVPALLWRPTRLLAYVAALTFHLMNAVLWDIGIFPWFMIGATLLFFPAESLRKLFRFPPIEEAPASTSLVVTPGQRLQLAGVGLFCVWQLLLPFRHYAYPGDVSWTEEGHHFAWHMMLREKDVGIRFYVVDAANGQRGLIRVEDFLNERQLSRMGKDADMVIEFVHHVRDHYRERSGKELEIYVLNIAALNGRKPQLLMDPTVNYAAVERSWSPQPWIMPLTESLRVEGWKAPLDQWEQILDLDLPEMMRSRERRAEESG
ncbi:HTTM domain-containing protein [Blastopirellula marina]|uniref:Vitamin K-dependent gamma-carboxylase n=1 Tax=Blastopirellula marina DSM 3645 TaxID=314230 RepID=A3ZVB2_9BACT|nr:HTTM domain-containing protein [Blastopirellula marina]EAQ79258.1 Vitamin K-dependent gamma-carboxylase [Blastopirellula marina DSM 3645]